MTANFVLIMTTMGDKVNVKAVEFSLEKVWKWQCFDCEFLEIWEWLKITRGLLISYIFGFQNLPLINARIDTKGERSLFAQFFYLHNYESMEGCFLPINYFLWCDDVYLVLDLGVIVYEGRGMNPNGQSQFCVTKVICWWPLNEAPTNVKSRSTTRHLSTMNIIFLNKSIISIINILQTEYIPPLCLQSFLPPILSQKRKMLWWEFNT